MAEQSHKREMNDAVRGDFERLRARRARSGAPESTPALEPEAAATREPAPAEARRRSWPFARRRRPG